MDSPLAAICAYVIKDIFVIATICVSGNTIRIFNRKRVVLTLKIVGNSIGRLIKLYRIAVSTDNGFIVFNNTGKRFSIFCSKNRCYENARCTGCQENTLDKRLPFFTFEFRFHNFNSFVYKTLIKINIKTKKLRKKPIYTANVSQNIAIQIHLFSQNFTIKNNQAFCFNICLIKHLIITY